MASYYIPLPSAEYPRNALLDFSPIRQAAQDWRAADQDEYERRRQEQADQRGLANQAYERSRQEKSDLMQQQKFAWEKQKHDVGEIKDIDGNLVQLKPDGTIKVLAKFNNSIFGGNSFPSDVIGPQNNEPMMRSPSFNNPKILNNITNAQAPSDIVNTGPQAFYGTPKDVPARMEAPIPQTPTKPEGVRTPRGYITKEMATMALASPNAGDRELGKYVLKELEDKTPKALTENQTKMADYADRMIQSEKILENLSQNKIDPKTGKLVKGFDPTKLDETIGSKLGIFGNYYNSPEWKQYQQAAKGSLAAILRRDTGAAVTQAEFDLYFPMLFPQPNDPPEVVEQKATSRKRMAEGLRRGSGGAYEQMFSDVSQAPQTVSKPNTEIQENPYSLMSDEELKVLLEGGDK